MSDAASGPETDDEESKEDWRKRMEEAYGTAVDVKELVILEHVTPAWRSDEVRYPCTSFDFTKPSPR